jgi:hypothetical protein
MPLRVAVGAEVLLSEFGKVRDGVLIEPGMEDVFERERGVLFPGDAVKMPAPARILIRPDLPGVIPYGGDPEVSALLPLRPIVRECLGPYRCWKSAVVTRWTYDKLVHVPRKYADIRREALARPLLDLLSRVGLRDDPVCTALFPDLDSLARSQA